jgi:hypothetical protein
MRRTNPTFRCRLSAVQQRNDFTDLSPIHKSSGCGARTLRPFRLIPVLSCRNSAEAGAAQQAPSCLFMIVVMTRAQVFAATK